MLAQATLCSCWPPRGLGEETAHQNLPPPSTARDCPDAALPDTHAGEGDQRAVRRPTWDAHLARVEWQARERVWMRAASARRHDLPRGSVRLEVDVDEHETLAVARPQRRLAGRADENRDSRGQVSSESAQGIADHAGPKARTKCRGRTCPAGHWQSLARPCEPPLPHLALQAPSVALAQL
jgi:hypothetical protein